MRPYSKIKFIPLYFEHLNFLFKRAGWQVTKIYSHYTFEQERFKEDLIILNKKSRQKAKIDIEKDFLKHLNNSISDMIVRTIQITVSSNWSVMNEKKSYLNKYNSLFDWSFPLFVNSKLIKDDVERNYNEKTFKVKNDNFKVARINLLQVKKKREIESRCSVKTARK